MKPFDYTDDCVVVTCFPVTECIIEDQTLPVMGKCAFAELLSEEIDAFAACCYVEIDEALCVAVAAVNNVLFHSFPPFAGGRSGQELVPAFMSSAPFYYIIAWFESKLSDN